MLSGQDALIFNALRDSRLGKRSGDMSDLYWLTEAQMVKLSTFFPKSHGKPRVDDRRVLSGILTGDRHARPARPGRPRCTDVNRRTPAHALLLNLPDIANPD